MVGFCVVLYLFVGILNFCSCHDLVNDEKLEFKSNELLFYKIFNKRWKRITIRLTWFFLWPVWFLLDIVIGLAFLFRESIYILIK